MSKILSQWRTRIRTAFVHSSKYQITGDEEQPEEPEEKDGDTVGGYDVGKK